LADYDSSVSTDPKPVDITPHRGVRGEVLSRDHFLTQLHREKRRADRSREPLSLVVMSFAGCDGFDEADVSDIITDLSLSKRETDIVGHFGDGVVVFLLPYSEAAAAEAFSRLIVSRANTPVAEVKSATYPDPSFDALLADSLAQAEVADVSPSLSSQRQGFSHLVKRMIDVIGAIVLLIVAAPLMLIIALAIKLTSPGPVVFRQMRIGKEGKPFPFYKFRSMRCDNDDSIHREYVKSLIEGRHDEVNEGDAYDPVYKLQSDGRITGVGRIIRRTSIDELPQLFNVLKGEMSLVGPRPPIAYETENYQSWHMRRLQEVRPGITGLWQVEGRSKTTFDEMVRLDLRYIRNWSLWLDMKILFKTVFVVLRGDGAD
jgi:exopolysaccharide biosynthesis polyprenyl glycosylphosphotransferase